MPTAPPRTLAAEKALLALLKALPAGGALQLKDGTPAAATVAGLVQPLGRAPLSRGQVEALLGEQELTDAFAAGPGGKRQWALEMAGKSYAASFEWQPGEPWQVTLAEGPLSIPPPVKPPAPTVSAALQGLRETGTASSHPPPATGAASAGSAPLRPIALATSGTPPASGPAISFGKMLSADEPPKAALPVPPPAASVAPVALVAPVAPPVAVPAPASFPVSAPAPLATSAADTVTLPPALVSILSSARAANAADLHLQSRAAARHRVGGALKAQGEPLDEQTVATYAAALVPPHLQSVLQEKGSVDFALAHESAGRFRANVSKQATGLKICLRLVPAEAPSLSDLHLPSDVEAIAQYHQGLAIVAGPKGHGKTNTLAAIVRAINERARVHIITVEDPIEVVHAPRQAVISQRQIGLHTQSFARALKGALREDPDVIVIGELRDRETVEIALAAAETGHLVLATMSTRSAAKTVDRLIDLFPPDQQQQVRATLAGALKMVVSQRLVPTKDGQLLPAIEVMTGSVPLWTLIRENKMFQLPSLQQRGRSIGMVRLDQSLEALFKDQHIDAETALSFAEERAELQRVLREKYQVQATPDDSMGVKGAT